jgi:hypothetical protein
VRCVFDFVLIGGYRLGHGANDDAAPTTIYYLTASCCRHCSYFFLENRKGLYLYSIFIEKNQDTKQKKTENKGGGRVKTRKKK